MFVDLSKVIGVTVLTFRGHCSDDPTVIFFYDFLERLFARTFPRIADSTLVNFFVLCSSNSCLIKPLATRTSVSSPGGICSTAGRSGLLSTTISRLALLWSRSMSQLDSMSGTFSLNCRSIRTSYRRAGWKCQTSDMDYGKAA